MNVSSVLDICEENDISLKVVGENLKVVSKTGQLSTEIKGLLKENKQALIDMLKAANSDGEEVIPVFFSSDNDEYELSSAQQRQWFLYNIDRESASNNIAAAFSIDGELNKEYLEQAFRALIDRHSTLRTVFAQREDGSSFQTITDSSGFRIKHVDLSDVDPQCVDAQIQKWVNEESVQPFCLETDLMIRVTCISISDQRNMLLVTQHHIASDGWSIDVLLKDVGEFYRSLYLGEKARLPVLPVQYVDYARWQNAYLQGDVLEQKLSFWRTMLSGAPEVHGLPLDNPRPKKQSSEGKVFKHSLNPNLVARISQLALEKGVSNFMLYHALFSFLVSRLSGDNDVVVGSPISNRSQAETHNMVGYFSNTVAIRSDFSDVQTLSDVLTQAKYKILSAQEHQDVPFEVIVDDLKPSRNLSHNPICQLMVNYQSGRNEDSQGEGLQINSLQNDKTLTNFDITLCVEETEGAASFFWEYQDTIFTDQTISEMSESFVQLLSEATNKCDEPIANVSLLSPLAERTLLNELVKVNKHTLPDTTFHQLVEEVVESNPKHKAVVCGSDSISYEQLNARANQFAFHLRDQGLQVGDLVCVLTERTIEMVTVLLGILKAGGVYLPIDGKNPESRLKHIVADSGAKLIVARDVDRFKNFASTAIPMASVSLDASDSFIDGYSDENPSVASSDGESCSAYAIYTSGSTGLPKGALLSHAGLVNLAKVTSKKFNISSESKILQFSSFTFDAATWDFALALSTGAELHMVPQTTIGNPCVLGDYVKDHNITYSFFTPSLLNTLRIEDFVGVKTIAVGGEAVSLSLAKKWSKNRRLFNAYGPTEATVVTTCQALNEISDRVTIGEPLDNVCCFVVDANGKPVPNGVVGEMCIAGVGVAQNYLNNPELTEQKFITNHFPGVFNSRFYKTGDLVRRLPSGQFEFRGRIDDQVKIRGFRIELGEIDSKISAMPSVRDCVTVVTLDAAEKNRLVTYICAESTSDSQRESFVTALREFAKASLPEYMVPAAFVVMDEIPLNSSGKVDKSALPEPDISAVAKVGYVAPRSTEEESLCKCWEGVLGVSPIGIEDNFFALGGDSILCLQLVSRAKLMGVNIAIEDIFEHQTIKGLAGTQTKHQEPAPQVEIKGEMPLMPIQQYFFSGNVDKHHYNQTAILLVPSAFDANCLHQTVRAFYQRHDALRLTFTAENKQCKAVFSPLNDEWVDNTIDVLPLAARGTLTELEYIQKHCADAQARMDLEKGPLFQALYFPSDEAGHSRLTFIVHHLVIDAVSWRTVMDDLSTCYLQWAQKGSISLPDKTHSYQQWSKAIQDYAHRQDFQESKSFWLNQLSRQADSIQPDRQSDDIRLSSSRSVLGKLDCEQTRDLLVVAGRNNASQMNNILLAALSLSAKRWQGLDHIGVIMESHGRDTHIKRMDLSQTVGWFTAIYPLALHAVTCSDEERVGRQLHATDTLLEQATKRILDYGVLRYSLNDDEITESSVRNAPEIMFNYLGQNDQIMEEQLFEVSSDDIGPTTSVNRLREYLLDVKVLVANKQLCVVVDYSSNQFNEKTIESLVGHYIESLKALIAHCSVNGYGESAANDEQKIQLVRLGDETRRPASFFQTMMLEGLQQGARDSTLSIPFHWRMKGDLNTVALKQSLQSLYARHRALATGFALDDKKYFSQASTNQALTVQEHDIANLPESERELALITLLKNLTAEGFDLEQGPMMKSALVRLGEQDHAIVCLFHHIVFDGWSLKIVKDEVAALYRAYTTQTPPRLRDIEVDMGDYAQWQRDVCDTQACRQRIHQMKASLGINRTIERISTDRPRSHSNSRALGCETLVFDQASVNKLTQFSAREGLTNYGIFALAFRLSLYLYSEQSHLVLSSPQADRDQDQVQGTVGVFLNYLVVNALVNRDDRLFDFFKRGKQAINNAYKNADINIFAVTEGMDDRLTIHEALQSVQIQYLDTLNNSDTHLQLKGVDVSPLVDDLAIAETHNDLSAVVRKNGDEIRCQLAFNQALFDKASVSSILLSMNKIVGLLVNSDDVQISRLRVAKGGIQNVQ